jgi:hypothetical protein
MARDIPKVVWFDVLKLVNIGITVFWFVAPVVWFHFMPKYGVIGLFENFVSYPKLLVIFTAVNV